MEIIARNMCVPYMRVYTKAVRGTHFKQNTMLMRALYGHSAFSYTLDPIVKGCVTCARSEFFFLFTSNNLHFSFLFLYGFLTLFKWNIFL